MANEKALLPDLPATQVIETVYVRLDDGRIVARTPEELAELGPGELQPAIVARSNT